MCKWLGTSQTHSAWDTSGVTPAALEERYHVELCDNRSFLKVFTANRVLDLLDGHLIPLHGMKKRGNRYSGV